jgi:arylsulfatase A-like enzyme
LVATTTKGYIPENFEEKWSLDINALNLLTQDVDRWETQGQRFAVAFLPECGHFPLPALSGGSQRDTVAQRGRAVMARQDAFLGQIVRLLEAHHRLDQTLIVVTSDHGVRLSIEDPSLPIGMTDEYSFHVPLLIYASQALSHTETVPWLTSHIDVAPSLLDLLGIERGRDSEQGSPIWDSRLQERTTFFFGDHYLGADAYYSKGQFFMRNEVFDTVYQNDRLHFAASDAVPPASPRYTEVTATIRRMVALQQTWTATLGQPRTQGDSEDVAKLP